MIPDQPKGADRMFLDAWIPPVGSESAAEALLVRNGRVAAVGTEAEIRAAAGANPRIESLAGATVTPGFVDAHIHPTAWALARRRIDLSPAMTVEDALERISGERAAAAGEWVRGGGWSFARWGRWPTRAELDRVLPDRPAVLDSQDTHAVWLNSDALDRCGIDRHTPDPDGGRILRDSASGEPSGVLLENAKSLAVSAIPEPDRDEVTAALLDAQQELHSLGIVGIHSVEPEGLRDFEELRVDDRLRLRVLQHLPLAHLDVAIESGVRSGMRSPPDSGRFDGSDSLSAGEWIRIGGVKIFLDGTLGSRTAWMREPYVGEVNDRGMQTLPTEEFRAHVRRAAQAGIASTVHAIGDAAVELAVEVLGSVFPPRAVPHRIEHLQLCPPELWPRVAKAEIVASMQPVHLLTDIPAAERNWGRARSRGAYAFAPLLQHGAVLAFGSDAPVETPDPRPGLLAAVRRRPREGIGWSEEGEWFPEHRITTEAAIRAYTEGAARAAGQEGERGRLLPGYAADLVVWSRDPFTCPPDELLEMRCLLTMVGGEVVFRAQKFK